MMPTAIHVNCTQGGCTAVGVVRRVHMRQIALGVIDMPRLVCAACGSDMHKVADSALEERMTWNCIECTTRYAVGLPACPHCGSSEYRPSWEEDQMPKIYADGRPPSNAADQTVEPEPEQPAQEPSPVVEQTDDPEPVPEGTVQVLLDWVDSDPERAQRALAAEQARDKPRATAVAALQQLQQLAADE